MKFTPTERLILANQLQILEHVDYDQAPYYAYQRKALQSGYEAHYADLFQEIHDKPMSEQQCDIVVEVGPLENP